MRVLPAFVSLFALSLLAVGVAAQDPDGEPGCPQSNPCEVELGLDATGIYDLSYDTFGTGDWILFSVFNDDEVQHTVTLEGHAFEFSIGPGDINDTRPFKLGSPGSYDLKDQPTGDSAAIVVEAEEVFTDGSATDDDAGTKSPIPGPAPALVLVGLAAAAFVARRR